jgi:hypothetical protein
MIAQRIGTSQLLFLRRMDPCGNDRGDCNTRGDASTLNRKYV